MKQAVVIGAGQGGLSAAIHLRLHGFEVTVIEPNYVGGKAASVSVSGFKLDPGPSIVILPEIYDQVFDRAGTAPEDRIVFDRLTTISRVFFEDKIVDLPSDRKDCLELVRQLAPEDARSLEHMLDRMAGIYPAIESTIFAHPIHQPWQLLDPRLIKVGAAGDLRKPYKEIVDHWFKSKLLRSFFYGFPSYGGQTYDNIAPGALLIPFLMIEKGVFYPRGGVAAIPAAFHRLALSLGVQFITERVQSLEVKGSRVSGVVASGRTIPADVVVSNVDRLATGRWLGRVPTSRPSFSYHTFHWGIRREIPGLDHHNLLIPEGFEAGFEALYRKHGYPNPPIVYLNATSVLDRDAAPEGSTNLFAVITSPGCEPDIDWDRQTEATRTQLRRTLDMHGLGFSDEEIVFERVQTPKFFEERDGNYLGSLYGPDEKDRLWNGAFPLRCADEQIKNLFYAGGSVQPGAGLPMVTLSGKFAADLAVKAG